MLVSGFTFVRNAVVFGYPLAESLSSLLPLCDELIVAAGKSDDSTLDLLKSLDNPKIRIIETEWDKNLKTGGRIYAEQTNIALAECRGDWCIYLQADEVIHEQDYDSIQSSIRKADSRKDADALLFGYKHFYGSYNYIGAGRQWYRREIRAFRNSGNITSWRDAQGFRKKQGDEFLKMKAIGSGATIYHYGWVKQAAVQHKKQSNMTTYYFEDYNYDHKTAPEYDFDYKSAFELEPYSGTHPAVMEEKIAADSTWAKEFNPEGKLLKKPFMLKISDAIERKTGLRLGEYKNYIEIK